MGNPPLLQDTDRGWHKQGWLLDETEPCSSEKQHILGFTNKTRKPFQFVYLEILKIA
jgi:hypothetical protein